MAINTQPSGLAAIQRAAKANGIGWQAPAAIASYESGLNPSSVGDQGTSFGLFQLHQGGALPAGTAPALAKNADWNANFAARQIKALGIQNLPVAQQIAQISKRFERPADPATEIARATEYWRTHYAGLPGQAPVTTAPQQAQPLMAQAPSALPQLSLAPLQQSFTLGAAQNQRALDALEKISGRSVLAAPAPDLASLLQMSAATTAPALTSPTLTTTPTRPTAPTQTTPTIPARTGKGYTVGNFEGTKVASWMVPALTYARQHGWAGKLTSGLRSTALQAQLYARYQAGGNIAAKPGQSNHEIENGGAFDATDAHQLNQILKTYKGQRPIWAPTVGLNDSVHFSKNGH